MVVSKIERIKEGQTMKAKKRTATTIRTREELEAAVGEYAKHAFARASLVLEMDKRINAIRQEFDERVAELDGQLESMFGDLEAWAMLNPGEFVSKRSLELVHGVLGFRTGNPTLKCVKGVKWDHVLDMLMCNRMANYIRTTSEVNKDSVIADREKIGADRLQALGMRVEQADRFYVELKSESK